MDVPYCGFVIKVGARRLDSGEWLPEAAVEWVEFGTARSRALDLSQSKGCSTADAAEAVALRLAQRWVDQVR